MQATHHIDNLNKLILTEWKGNADADKFIRYYGKYQDNIKSNQELDDYNEIVDFSRIKNININMLSLKRYADFAVSFDRHAKTKLALIVKPGMAYGLATGYVAIRKLNPKNHKIIKVFVSAVDALSWINSD